ncbi:hypothetical protein [Maribacter sp. Hel_I_7]|uniref:hypothetical protein n=1 Tax=Maribacter sp. Hel_I_7 TaxID=1249997 RepID=UPI00047EB8B9|nr:hypothetical protein [Maribacter sp. Hel_I_7]
MKNSLKLLVVVLLAPMALLAQEESIEFDNATSVLTWLMPLITLGVTWLVKKIAPFVTGTTTLIVVPLIATASAYLGTLASDGNFIVMFLTGLGSVFLNQLYRSVTSEV